MGAVIGKVPLLYQCRQIPLAIRRTTPRTGRTAATRRNGRAANSLTGADATRATGRRQTLLAHCAIAGSSQKASNRIASIRALIIMWSPMGACGGCKVTANGGRGRSRWVATASIGHHPPSTPPLHPRALCLPPRSLEFYSKTCYIATLRRCYG